MITQKAFCTFYSVKLGHVFRPVPPPFPYGAVTTGTVQTNLLAAPVVPQLCSPFQLNNSQWVVTEVAHCQSQVPPMVPMETLNTTYAPFVCSASDGAGIIVEGNDQATRGNCMVVGKPLQQNDYVMLKNQSDSIVVRAASAAFLPRATAWNVCSCRLNAP
jgi:hypothetical protein